MHGIGVSSRSLVPTAARLARRYRVLLPDLPGSGRSPPPRGRPGLDLLADALGGWLDAAGLERAPLVAHSFGCQVATRLAELRPERVPALVLVAPTVDRHARTLAAQLFRAGLDATREPVALLALIALDYGIFAARGGAALVRDLLADRIEERLPALRIPALVVRGSRDPIVPQRWADEVAAALPRGELRLVDGSPHAVPYAAPDALARLVDAFLRGPALGEV